MSMIISRKHIILAALVLALGTAIFLNWKFSSANGGLDIAGVFNTASTLGDASYVDNQKVSGATDSYFAQARTDRQKAIANAQELLKTLSANASATAQDKQTATTAITALSTNLQSEMTIEQTVKAKGFSDCVAFINNGSINVVVKPKTGDALTAAESAQIYDIVIQQTKLSTDKIHIIPAK